MSVFKPGKYYIGDLCYVMNDSEWDDFLDVTMFDSGEFTFKGEQVWINSTSYGDGGYTGNDGNCYSVDSGTIGIIPVSIADISNISELGQIKEFANEFTVDYNNGVFQFGDLVIDTRGSYAEDDENDDEDDYTDPDDEEDEDIDYSLFEEKVE